MGVPVYQGQDMLPVTLECLRTQSYANLDVLISVDAADEASAEAARPFLADPRFRMEVQPTRLGWAGNSDWTIRNRRGEFWIYQQHDDQVSPTYVEDLVGAAHAHPGAAVLYSEMQISGTYEQLVRHPSLVGGPVQRALMHLKRLDTSSFRGLIRGGMLDRTHGLKVDAYESFASFHVLLAELALQGEVLRVDGPTYYKRLHGANLHLKWRDWTPERKRGAWASLAAGMIQAIVPAGETPDARWRLLLAVLDRFVRKRRNLWMFYEPDPEDAAGRAALIGQILEQVQPSWGLDLAAALETPWPKLQRRAIRKLGGTGG
jgi:glycosyltransferase involved in cell wall biosynthesis